MTSNRAVAVVTGAGRGIGKALADTLVERGYDVVAVVRSAEHAGELKSAHVYPLLCDVTENETESRLKTFLEENFKAVDLLINNAGSGATAYGIEDLKYEELQSLLDVHCYGPIRVVKACLPALRSSSNACIVNISSRFGSLEWVATRLVPQNEATYAYRIAKAAMNMLTSCLAVELEGEKIRVLAVDPGKVKTRFGPKNADLEPQEAARSIVDLIHGEPRTAVFVSAASGEKVPW